MPSRSSRPDRSTTPRPPNDRPGGHLLLRLHWMMLGGMLMAMLALVIINDGHALLSATSLGIWLVAGSMVAARWVDMTRFRGLTADGEPATPADFRRYTGLVAVASAAVWAGAHALG